MAKPRVHKKYSPWTYSPRTNFYERTLGTFHKISSRDEERYARRACELLDHVIALRKIQLSNPYIKGIRRKIANIIYSFSFVFLFENFSKKRSNRTNLCGLAGLPSWVREYFVRSH